MHANQKRITIDGDVKIHDIHGSVYASTTLGKIKVENINGGVHLTTNKGDIKIDHVLGAITATTPEGDIRFSDCEGSISSQTTFGDIRRNMNKLQGHLKLVTRNGDLTARIPKDTGLDMKIKGQELHVPDLVLPVEITKNQIFGKANGGGIPVELLTTSGSATLLLS